MKFQSSLLLSLLASVAIARPHIADEGDILQQWSRVTAFVVDDHGKPSVECWEVSTLANGAQSVQRADGSKATARSITLASHRELDGVDVLTWPSVSPIWPPSDADSVHSDNFDLSNTFNLFNIQGGLINFNFYAARFGMAGNDDDDEVEQHIFSLENGDDWFYFEDTYTGSSLARSANAPEHPFSISTISGSETEALRLRFNTQPKHKVVHKGACHFTGIRTDTTSSRRAQSSREHNPLTVQVRFEDGL